MILVAFDQEFQALNQCLKQDAAMMTMKKHLDLLHRWMMDMNYLENLYRYYFGALVLLVNCRCPGRVVAGHLVAGIDDDCEHLVEGTGFVECLNMGTGFEEGVDFGASIDFGVGIDFDADLGVDFGSDFGAGIDFGLGIGASFDQGNDSDFVADLDANFGFDSDRL